MAENKEIKEFKSESGKSKKRFSFKSLGSKIAKSFREYKSEFKKIVWPTPKQVAVNTMATIVFCLLVGAFIALIDWLLGLGLSLIISA